MAGTQITPAGIGGGGLDQINNAFGSIYSMFGNPSGGSSMTGGGSGGFGMSPQSISGADNSVTAAQRTASNIFGQMAPSAFSMGQGLLGTGTGVAQGGLDVMGTGLSTLQPSIDFYTKLLSGDPTVTTAALAPTAANIAAITSGATDAASRGMPGGGYRASTLAGLPFAQAAQVGNAALGLQPAAAQALAGLGGEQAQIGQGMAGVGTTLGGLGANLTGQGLSGIANLYNALLQKQNINQQATPLTAFDQFASGFSKIAAPVGGILSGIGNLGGGGGGGGGYDAGYLASSPGGGG